MAAFAGVWVDDLAAGKCEGFDEFVKGMGYSAEQIEGYRGHIGKQEVIVDGNDWTYISDFAGQKSTNKFKLDIKNPPDTDLEGNKFQTTPKLVNDKHMIEVIETKRPNGLVTTTMERKIIGDGSKQHIVISHKESGAKMSVYMHKE
ncbi:uncharacterized protein [Argopecten irradians]|uniref:uncharacterized protein isoform X2 n=1 Tax=Argopecten irradians TaxID=31199 RepID=UPI00371D6516